MEISEFLFFDICVTLFTKTFVSPISLFKNAQNEFFHLLLFVQEEKKDFVILGINTFLARLVHNFQASKLVYLMQVTFFYKQKFFLCVFIEPEFTEMLKEASSHSSVTLIMHNQGKKQGKKFVNEHQD